VEFNKRSYITKGEIFDIITKNNERKNKEYWTHLWWSKYTKKDQLVVQANLTNEEPIQELRWRNKKYSLRDLECG